MSDAAKYSLIQQVRSGQLPKLNSPQPLPQTATINLLETKHLRFEYDNDGALSSLDWDGVSLQFVWNADGSLNEIIRTKGT
jgi:YD repeat-containing protein